MKGVILAGGLGTRLSPADAGHQQAPAAGLRQADDLLPDRVPGQRRHPGHHDRHRRQQRGRLPAPAGQRQGVRPGRPELHLPGRARAASPTPCGWPSTSPTATRSCVILGDNIIEKQHPPGGGRLLHPAARGQDPAEGGGRPAALRRGRDSTATRVVGIEEKPQAAQEQLRRHRHLHVRRRRSSRSSRPSSPPAAASWRSPTSTTPTSPQGTMTYEVLEGWWTDAGHLRVAAPGQQPGRPGRGQPPATDEAGGRQRGCRGEQEQRSRMRTYFVTGAAGFIGSNFVRQVLDEEPEVRVIAYDALTYAGNLENLAGLPGPPAPAVRQGRHLRRRGGRAGPGGRRRRDRQLRRREPRRPQHPRLRRVHPHQRRGHAGPAGRGPAAGVGRFLQVSTDEVYGSLGPTGQVHRDDAASPQQPLQRQQGGGRPAGAWRTTTPTACRW